nr:probable calcium-binding protein CML25 [Ipomoea batatas]
MDSNNQSLKRDGSDTVTRPQQVFNKFDVKGDDKISWSELGSIMGSLSHVATEEELKAMIWEVDGDDNGFIDLREFIELNTQDIDSEEVLRNLKDAFSVFDIDKNGSISVEELQNVMHSLVDDCSIAECRKMISGVDRNGDGMIDFEDRVKKNNKYSHIGNGMLLMRVDEHSLRVEATKCLLNNGP